MQTCTRTFAKSIKTLDGRAAIKIYLDASTHIVCCRANRDVFLSDIYADRETFLVDIWEVVLCLFWVFMGDIKTYMIYTMNLHLLIYSARYDIAWREREAFVIFLHECFASRQLQYATIATHSLCDEVCRMCLRRVVE